MWTGTQQLWTNGVALAWIGGKALLTAVLGFRIGERRTLAEMSAFDFVAAVASGAIVGRVPNSDTMLNPSCARLLDHPPRSLVLHGEVRERQLKRCGLTKRDLHGLLRDHNISSLSEVHVAVLEQRGEISVVRECPGENSKPN